MKLFQSDEQKSEFLFSYASRATRYKLTFTFAECAAIFSFDFS